MPATNRIPCLVITSQDAKPNARKQLYPLSLVGYAETQNPMPVANRTPCLVNNITRRRTQCPQQIVLPVSCVISQDSEPNARSHSYLLSRL